MGRLRPGPHFASGWRAIYVAGGLGLIFLYSIVTRLPESPRWLESTGRTQQADNIVEDIETLIRAEGHHLAEPRARANSTRLTHQSLSNSCANKAMAAAPSSPLPSGSSRW